MSTREFWNHCADCKARIEDVSEEDIGHGARYRLCESCHAAYIDEVGAERGS